MSDVAAALGLLCALPLWADAIARLLGWHIFFLADPRIQAALATVVQFGTGWRFYAGPFRTRSTGERLFDLLVAISSSGLYGYSLWQSFLADGPVRIYFTLSTGLILLASVIRTQESIR